MILRRQFRTVGLPPPLPLLPTKPPAADEGAQFDMSFDPMGGDYARQYYQNLFKGLMPEVQSSAPLDEMPSMSSTDDLYPWTRTNPYQGSSLLGRGMSGTGSYGLSFFGGPR